MDREVVDTIEMNVKITDKATEVGLDSFSSKSKLVQWLYYLTF